MQDSVVGKELRAGALALGKAEEGIDIDAVSLEL